MLQLILYNHRNDFSPIEYRFPLSSIFNKKGAKPNKRFRSCTCFMMFTAYLKLRPWQFLNFFPLPQGHGSFGRGIFSAI